MKKGRSLVFYIDGNSGIGGMGRNDDKLTQIQFLNQPIFARKGIAFMSHLMNIPIVPTFIYRPTEWTNTICFHEPIWPDKTMDREVSCHQTTQFIYGLFEDYVLKYPTQWEGWFYIHKFMDLQKKTQEVSDNWSFNEKRYCLVPSESNDYYLLDRITDSFCSISATMNKLLQALRQNRYPLDMLKKYTKPQLIDDLSRKEVIVNF